MVVLRRCAGAVVLAHRELELLAGRREDLGDARLGDAEQPADLGAGDLVDVHRGEHLQFPLGKALDRVAERRGALAREQRVLRARVQLVGLDGVARAVVGSYRAAGGTDATYGPIARYAYDVGNWDTGLWLVFHGASGHPGSPHYADQTDLWARGAMIPALYNWARIEALAKSRQTFTAG